MTSMCPSAFVSLDEPLALLYESLGKLKAAKSVDIVNFTQQLRMAAESAHVVRELVWAELPGAAWQSREQLDALNKKIQDIVAARTLEQLRSRLLALATELERGSIVHRRAHRLSELNQLRDQAVSELRAQAGLQGTPPTLPGPQADQWIEWACGLQEPQDAESLQILRDGFAHLDDFVANLEYSMWVAAGSPPSETPPEPRGFAAKTQPEQSRPQPTGLQRPVVSSGSNLAIKVALDPECKEVAAPISPENPPLNRPEDVAAPGETPAAQYKVSVLSDALAVPLASLDEPLALLYESLAKLKAAQVIDIAGVIEQLKMAAESARNVRELVLSELPEASWQNRQELDALLEKIQTILDARELEQQRSHLLALATELERGTIVHRRAHRLSELNQLRDQAINELRFQAGLEATPQTLPGPQADQWIEWACGLKEPDDAESLQMLRKGFARLDDFVANLECNMWIAAESPTVETPLEAERSAGKTGPEPSHLKTTGLEELETTGLAEPVVSAGPNLIESEVTKPSRASNPPQFPGLLDGRPLPVLESNTLTPNDITPPRSEEDVQRMLAQEQALLASMMGLVNDPVSHFTPSVERPSIEEVFPEPSPPPMTASDLRTSDLTAPDLTTEVKKLWAGKWRLLLVPAAVLLLAGLGAIQWRSRSNRGGNASVKASERVTDVKQSNPEDKGHGQSTMPTNSGTQTSSPKTQTKEQPKAEDRSVAPKLLAKASPATPSGELHDAVLQPPAEAPRNHAMVNKEETPANGRAEIPGAVPGGVPNGVPNVATIARDIPVAIPKVAAQKVRVSSGVAQGLLLHEVAPKYPQLAREARIQGTVVLQAVIGKDGTVQNLHVLSGHPMLTQAAMDAVKKWRYKPYYVNGEPVDADTQINVNFTLSGR